MARTRWSRAARIDTARYRAWQTMRLMRKAGRAWTVRELAALAEAGKRGINVYVRGLARHGYLQQAAGPAGGPGAAGASWRLVRDTGPMAPRLRRDGGLLDPNLAAEEPVPVPAEAMP